jgi:hypothetical protein
LNVSRNPAIEPLRIHAFLTCFVRALGDRDYRWAWIAKILLLIGYSLAMVYEVSTRSTCCRAT